MTKKPLSKTFNRTRKARNDILEKPMKHTNSEDSIHSDKEANQETTKSVEEELIKRMVYRFLGWKLPDHFNPDAGISFQREYNIEYNAKRGFPPAISKPVGTNLFDADQAEEMVRYMVGELLTQAINQTRKDGYQDGIQEMAEDQAGADI